MFVSVFCRFLHDLWWRVALFVIISKKIIVSKKLHFHNYMFWRKFLANSVILDSQSRKNRFLFFFFQNFQISIWKIAHFCLCMKFCRFFREKIWFFGIPLNNFSYALFQKFSSVNCFCTRQCVHFFVVGQLFLHSASAKDFPGRSIWILIFI